ncbi:MAG: YitT family protein [Prolixibacteraceae bacterium]|nr:YitT family protein [Prolixibacteraceae bacterium]
MTLSPRERLFSTRWFLDYGMITIGSFIMAIGYVYFITPHKIVPGGVYGLGIIVHYLTKGIAIWPDGFPIGLFNLLVNIPLTYIGIKTLGRRFGVKTIYGFVSSSIFMDGITMMRMVGDAPLVQDVLLSCIFGGVLTGIGLGLIFKARATSGGSDIVAMIITKYTRIPIGQMLIWVDCAIVVVALAAFKDWQIPLYSILVIYITGRAVDMILEGANYNKALIIISEEHEKIRDKIVIDLERGGTYLKGIGMYTNAEKSVIFTVVSRREVAILEEQIAAIDPHAFITIMDASEILGEGFRSLKHKVED